MADNLVCLGLGANRAGPHYCFVRLKNASYSDHKLLQNNRELGREIMFFFNQESTVIQIQIKGKERNIKESVESALSVSMTSEMGWIGVEDVHSRTF